MRDIIRQSKMFHNGEMKIDLWPAGYWLWKARILTAMGLWFVSVRTLQRCSGAGKASELGALLWFVEMKCGKILIAMKNCNSEIFRSRFLMKSAALL